MSCEGKKGLPFGLKSQPSATISVLSNRNDSQNRDSRRSFQWLFSTSIRWARTKSKRFTYPYYYTNLHNPSSSQPKHITHKTSPIKNPHSASTTYRNQKQSLSSLPARFPQPKHQQGAGRRSKHYTTQNHATVRYKTIHRIPFIRSPGIRSQVSSEKHIF